MFGVFISRYFVSSSHSYTYILFVVEYISKWVVTKATYTNDSKVVIDFLRSDVYAWLGRTREINSDGGNYFCFHVFYELLKKFYITQKMFTPIHT